MLVTPVMNGYWLLTRRLGPVKPVWLNAICFFFTWVQKWWSLMSGSFISLVGTRAYCGSSVALRWLSWWIYLCFSLLDKVPHSLLQSVSYRQQRGSCCRGWLFFSHSEGALAEGSGWHPEVGVSWNNVYHDNYACLLWSCCWRRQKNPVILMKRCHDINKKIIFEDNS